MADAQGQPVIDPSKNVLDLVNAAIESLRRSQYEAQGQQTQVVERRAETSETQARSGGVGMWVGVAVSVFALFLTLVGLVAAVLIASA